ncbi:lipoyl synthase [Phycisphaerales bacterium AB-hyl4]|uniref:Lipoyl synthase n=1 Tax=Natronomicrosphaera hydrolytica TaxID=3242702 RepID=A0ABV4U2M8_9BACT
MTRLSLSDRILDNAPGSPGDFVKRKKPSWLRAKLPGGPGFQRMRAMLDEHNLHTVCSSAKCPNLGECWERGTATLMILGDVCTRSCGFCHIKTGRPPEYDADEPRRVGETAAIMRLKHLVITSVNRDELPDGGAEIWAETIREVRRQSPGTQVEVLIPDFCGDWDALQLVLDERPEILNHNLESVPRLYGVVRPQAKYERSIELLRIAKAQGLTVKTGIMVGIGETDEEIEQLMDDVVAGTRVAGVGRSNAATDVADHHLPPNPNRGFDSPPAPGKSAHAVSGAARPDAAPDKLKRGGSHITHSNPHWHHPGPTMAPDMASRVAQISYPQASYPGVHETCDILTVGQYLQPTRNHLPISRWVTPDQFAEYKRVGEAKGFRHVESGPLVRSSYHADDQVLQMQAAGKGISDF